MSSIGQSDEDTFAQNHGQQRRGPPSTKSKRSYADSTTSKPDTSGDPRSGHSPGLFNANLDNGRWVAGGDDFCNTPTGKGNCWQECAKLIADFDLNMCQNWGGEVDTLLVFAGLFSAILSAFVVEAFKWLMAGPDDRSADYLRQMVALMSNSSVSAVETTINSPSLPDNVVAHVNAYWFGGLTLSLSSALIGIVCKQWLREYLRDTNRSHETNLAVRQIKYHGLTAWHVGTIIAVVPILLQISLFLFLAGVIELLWYLHRMVAMLVSGLGMLIVLFFVSTTILPGLQYLFYHGSQRLHMVSQLPFKSPQAWLFLRSVVCLANLVARLQNYLAILFGWKSAGSSAFVPPYPSHTAWTELDLDWREYHDVAAKWDRKPTALGLCFGYLELNFEHHLLRSWVWNCLWNLRQYVVDAKYVLQCVRGTPADSAVEPSLPQDALARNVLPVLDPRGASTISSELVMHILLTTSDRPQMVGKACVEHIVRVFNGLLIRNVREMPMTVYGSMQETLLDLPDEPMSVEMRGQLFFVARDILRMSQHAEQECGPALNLVSTIISHLSTSELHMGEAPLSLDLSAEIAAWLAHYPEPSKNQWRDYKARVMWAGQTAITLVQHLSLCHSRRGDEEPLGWHPHFPAVRDLVRLVDEKLSSIPRGVLPVWSPGKFNEEDFRMMKDMLDPPGPLSSTRIDDARESVPRAEEPASGFVSSLGKQKTDELLRRAVTRVKRDTCDTLVEGYTVTDGDTSTSDADESVDFSLRRDRTGVTQQAEWIETRTGQPQPLGAASSSTIE